MAETTDDAVPHIGEGQPVPGAEWLIVVIPPDHFAVAFPDLRNPSSAVFRHELFSADIESLTTHLKISARWPPKSVLVRFKCQDALELGYTVTRETEHGNIAHANVRFPGGSKPRASAKKLAEESIVIFPP